MRTDTLVIAARAAGDWLAAKRSSLWLWLSFIAYCAVYVPYSFLSKSLAAAGPRGAVVPLTIQIMPLLGAAGFIVTVVEFMVLGLIASRGADILAFWRRLKIEPSNAIGGLCCAMINITTNASYTMQGASLVTMLLLLRGGMTMLGPPADILFKKKISAKTWLAFCVVTCAFMCGLAGAGSIPLVGYALVVLYLAAYATNFSFFGKKQGDFEWLCSTQLVACASQLVISTVISCSTSMMDFTSLGADVMLKSMIVGALAQLTGIFGPMILMSPETEQTFSVALNRSGAMVSGVAAQLMIGSSMNLWQSFGVSLFISAIILLAFSKRQSSVQRSGTCDRSESHAASTRTA